MDVDVSAKQTEENKAEAAVESSEKTAEGDDATVKSEKTAEGDNAAADGNTENASVTALATIEATSKESRSSDYEINLAGNVFENRMALIEHIKAMQVRLEQEGSDGRLGDADKFLLFHLILKHPRIGEKLNNGPVTGFRYGCHDRFPQTKCFITIHP